MGEPPRGGDLLPERLLPRQPADAAAALPEATATTAKPAADSGSFSSPSPAAATVATAAAEVAATSRRVG